MGLYLKEMPLWSELMVYDGMISKLASESGRSDLLMKM